MNKILCVFALCFQALAFSQLNPHLKEISDRFASYSELPREVVYIHLNKSTYIKGEQIGFKAYVFDKDNKNPSQETNNLYCTLVDEKGDLVKKQLILINEGVGEGLFELDSLITGNTYRFKAYTNWMRNFSEPNYFEQEIRVLDPKNNEPIRETTTTEKVDAQFLPEGGHAVAGLEVVYGAIIKDQNGLGIPFVEATVVDEQDGFISNFKVNAMGIGRFALQTNPGVRYFVKFSHKEDVYNIPLGIMEPEGIVLKLQDLKSKLGLIFRAKFKDNRHLEAPYLLSFHDGDELRSLELSFKGKNEAIAIIPKEDLFKGVNTITLFNPDRQPILERLYYNSGSIAIHSDLDPFLSRNGDSLVVKLDFRHVSADKWNSLSASLLPGNTISYSFHNNLPSYHLLRPYVKGPVENASYYFRDSSPKRAFELDNLMITQGWSSYQWNTIFNKPPKSLFDFEKGLMFKVSLNHREDSQIYIFPTEFYPAQALELNQNNHEFLSDLFYPFKDEKLMISQYDKKGKPIVPKIFVQFKPSAIPDLKLDMFKRLPERTSEGPQEADFSQISFESLDRVQQLEGVTVVEDRTQTRLEQLSSKTMGEIDIFEDNDPKRNQFLSTYLSTRGYVVNEASGEFIIASRIPSTSGSNRPAIFLDGFLLFDYSILYQYPLNIIDYIEINPMGQGYGMYGGAGVIKIVTDPYRRAKYNSKPDYSTYEIPMAFEPEKRFYNPKYSSYSSGFFLKYGTLDWQPELRLEADGFLTIKFKNYGVSDIKLFLEGVVNGSEYVSDVIDLHLD